MPWTTPETFTAGQTLTAASMNKISGNLDALPRGYVIHSSKTTDQGSITGMTDVTGLSVSVPQVTGRRYLITVQLDYYSTATGDACEARLQDGSGTQLKRSAGLSNGNALTMTLLYYESASSTATVTRKIQFGRTSGVGTYTVQASATTPAFILVEDIGPA